MRENMLTWGEAAFNCLGPMNERTAASFPIAGQLFEWAHNATADQLAPAAFNEGVRYETPVHAFGRLATRDTDVEGVVIPAGARVALLHGSGNRDPRHYDDPDTFAIRRNPVDHLTFGYGPHGCAGQGLARLEAHATLAALARRVRGFSAGPSTRRMANMTRSYDSLPVTHLDPA